MNKMVNVYINGANEEVKRTEKDLFFRWNPKLKDEIKNEDTNDETFLKLLLIAEKYIEQMDLNKKIDAFVQLIKDTEKEKKISDIVTSSFSSSSRNS